MHTQAGVSDLASDRGPTNALAFGAGIGTPPSRWLFGPRHTVRVYCVLGSLKEVLGLGEEEAWPGGGSPR